MYQKLFLAFALVILAMSFAGPSATFAATPNYIDDDLKNGEFVYGSNDDAVQKVNKPFKLVVQIVGVVGGTIFIGALMFHAVALFFNSSNPQKNQSRWLAILGCLGAAFVFYGAAFFAETIASLANSTTTK